MAEKILKKRTFNDFGSGSGGPILSPITMSGLKLRNDLDCDYPNYFAGPTKIGVPINNTDAARSNEVPVKKTGTNGISANSLLSKVVRIREDSIGGSGLAKCLFASTNGLSLLKDNNSFTTNSGKLALTALNTGKFPDNLFSTSKIDDLGITNSKFGNSALNFSKFDSIFGAGLTRYDHLGVTNGALKLDLAVISLKITFLNTQWATSGPNKILTIESGVHGYSTNFSYNPVVQYVGSLEKINTSATVAMDSTYGDITITVPSGSEFSGYIICKRS
jgi:hypothetical protein